MAEIKTLAIKHKSVIHFPNWDTVKHILVLAKVDGSEMIPQLKSIYKLIKANNKKVVIVAYYPFKELKDEMLLEHSIYFISAKETNWKGLPSEVATILTGVSYDLVIDVSKEACLPLVWLALKSGAPLIAGRHLNDSFVDFELKIDSLKDETFLAEQILFYLRTIKSK